ncbi:MAG: VCBS repeat-containing protein [Vicinamibacteria bacterium]
MSTRRARLALSLLVPALGLAAAFPPAAADAPAADPPAGRAPRGAHFVDVTDAVGLDFRHVSSATSQKYLPETMGGGVAMLDADGDGRLDLFFANGARIDDPMPPGRAAVKDGPRYWNCLYLQRPDGRFVDATEASGLAGEGYSQGTAVGDYDGDGDDDLFVSGVFSNHLYRNDGRGRFTDVTAEAGIGGGDAWSTSAAFVDVDGDGRLDLFVGRYMKWSFAYNPHCSAAYNPFPEKSPTGPRAYCHPNLFPGATALLYRNEGGGRFRDVSAEAGVANPEGKSLGVAIADYDGDGRTDVFVANDAIRQYLYRNTAARGSRRRPSSPSPRSTRTAGRSREWASTSPTTTTTAGPTSSSRTCRTRATPSSATPATGRSRTRRGRRTSAGSPC